MARYENIKGVMIDATTIKSMRKMFPAGTGDESFLRVIKSVLYNIVFDEEPTLESPVEEAMYDQAIAFATDKAEQWLNKSSNFREHNPRKKTNTEETKPVDDSWLDKDYNQ